MAKRHYLERLRSNNRQIVTYKSSVILFTPPGQPQSLVLDVLIRLLFLIHSIMTIDATNIIHLYRLVTSHPSTVRMAKVFFGQPEDLASTTFLTSSKHRM